MIDHISSYAIDFGAAKAFYDAVLPGLGFACNTEIVAAWDPEFPTRRCAAYGPDGKPCFWVIETLVAPTPRHVAFQAPTRAAVDAFHRSGLAAGAGDHGAPGLRPIYHADYYGSFLIDPDGNNVEAVCHAPSA